MTYRDWDGARSKMSHKRAYDMSQQALETALRENRVRGECLEMAMKALDWYGHNYPALLCHKAGKALACIEARLAELESEEETK